MAANRLLQPVAQPGEDNRFSRPYGRVTRDDLETYARELNEGPMKGWFVNRDKTGNYFLDRQP